MKKNLSHGLNKKLTLYAAGATALLAGSQKAQAQIVYTQLTPDSTVDGAFRSATYYLDLNNDGIYDFKFTTFYFTGGSSYEPYTYSHFKQGAIYVQGLYGNAVLAPKDTTLPARLTQDSAIGASAKWVNNGKLDSSFSSFGVAYRVRPHSESVTGGYWQPGAGKYFLGLQLNVAGKKYYGWARLSVNSGGVFTVYDYAYNIQAGQPILSSQTVGVATGINTIESGKLNNIYPNPSTGNVFVNLPASLQNKPCLVQVFNETVTLVLETRPPASEQLPLDLSSQPQGLYLIKVTGDELTETYKVVVGR